MNGTKWRRILPALAIAAALGTSACAVHLRDDGYRYGYGHGYYSTRYSYDYPRSHVVYRNGDRYDRRYDHRRDYTRDCRRDHYGREVCSNTRSDRWHR